MTKETQTELLRLLKEIHPIVLTNYQANTQLLKVQQLIEEEKTDVAL